MRIVAELGHFHGVADTTNIGRCVAFQVSAEAMLVGDVQPLCNLVQTETANGLKRQHQHQRRTREKETAMGL